MSGVRSERDSTFRFGAMATFLFVIDAPEVIEFERVPHR